MDDLAAPEASKTAATKQNDLAADKNGQPIMHIKVYSPFKVYFDEPARSVSAANETGPFDILPRHHNFITLLKSGDLLIRTLNDEEMRVHISSGVMHVKADEIVVFLDV